MAAALIDPQHGRLETFANGGSMSGKAHVRQKLEELPGVTRTWIEWEAGQDGLTKTLVVEVAFDTDPNSSDCDTGTLDDIAHTAKASQTTMIISRLKNVPHNR